MVTIRILDQGSYVSNIEQSCIEHNSIQIHMYVKSRLKCMEYKILDQGTNLSNVEPDTHVC